MGAGRVRMLESIWRKVNDLSPTSTGEITGPMRTYFDSNGISYNYVNDDSYVPTYPD